MTAVRKEVRDLMPEVIFMLLVDKAGKNMQELFNLIGYYLAHYHSLPFIIKAFFKSKLVLWADSLGRF